MISIPSGHISIIAGDAGVGKSLIVLELVRRLLTDEPWPDGTHCHRLDSVMWLDAEGTEAVLADRIRSMGIDRDKIVFPFPYGKGEHGDLLRALMLDDRNQWKIFSDAVRKHCPALVVIDSMRGTHSGKEGDSQITILLRRIQTLARDTGAAILIVHHVRKREDETKPLTIHDLRGSGAIAANVRVVWLVEPVDPQDPQGQRRMVVHKSNLARFPDPLGVQIDTDGRVEFDELAEVQKAKSDQDRCAEFIRDKLTTGMMLSPDLDHACGMAGFKAWTIRSARAALKLKRTRPDGVTTGQWYSELPAAT